MRRWFLPLTVLGLGGVGAFLLSERGREALRGLWERFQDSPDGWQDLNDSVQTRTGSHSGSPGSHRGSRSTLARRWDSKFAGEPASPRVTLLSHPRTNLSRLWPRAKSWSPPGETSRLLPAFRPRFFRTFSKSGAWRRVLLKGLGFDVEALRPDLDARGDGRLRDRLAVGKMKSAVW